MKRNAGQSPSTSRRLLLALGTLPAWFWLSGARAQTAPKVYRVGILSPVDREAARPWFSAFEAGLQELGYVAGQNIALEYRFADGRFERLPARAGELVRLRPDVLLVQSTPANLAAKQATAEIPIVMINVADPVGAGLVASLARPGGNITGITNISADLAGKRVELLKEIMPQLSRMAVLLNPGDPNAALQMRSAESAARKLNVELQPVAEVRRAEDLEGAILACVRGGAGAAIRMVDPLGNPLRRRTVELAARHRLPIIYAFREDAEAGGLVSYGTNLPDQFKRAATFVDRILKGAKPDELPVEQPTNFELVINMKAAKALGLAIPQPFLLRADKVIE